MTRNPALLAVAALALTAGLSACSAKSSSTNTPQEFKAKVPAASGSATAAVSAEPTGPLTQQRREEIFLDATATHLCGIQSRVYTDPGSMASAYASKPIYPDLTDAQVETFQNRLVADPAFAERLAGKMRTLCVTAPASPTKAG